MTDYATLQLVLDDTTTVDVFVFKLDADDTENANGHFCLDTDSDGRGDTDCIISDGYSMRIAGTVDLPAGATSAQLVLTLQYSGFEKRKKKK